MLQFHASPEDQLYLKKFWKKSVIAREDVKISVAQFSAADLGWNKAHTDIFQELQSKLPQVVRRACSDLSLRLFVRSDSSKAFWDIAVTQCADEELREPVLEKKHESLALLRCHFNNSQEHWTTFAKELYAVV